MIIHDMFVSSSLTLLRNNQLRSCPLIRSILGIVYELSRFFTPLVGVMALFSCIGGMIADRFDWFFVGFNLLPIWVFGLILTRLLRRFES